MKEYPEWPFYNCNPNEGAYLEYLRTKPMTIGLSTKKYNPINIDEVKPGMVYINNNILSVQYQHLIIGDFYEISLIKYDISQKKKLKEIFGNCENGKIEYLNKKQLFNLIKRIEKNT